MAIQIITTRQAVQFNGVKVLVHGRAGSGKTPLCATAPQPLILSAEAGLMTLRAYDLPVILIRSIADLDEAYQYIAHSHEARQFWTICLDSISELAEICLTAEKAKSKDPRKAYGETQDKILERLRLFRDLPRHVYFSAKQERVKDEMTGLMLYGPSMPGQKMGPALPYMFDEIFSLEVAADPQTGRSYNYLRTERSPQFEARDRSLALDPIEEPHLGKIFDKIMRKAA